MTMWISRIPKASRRSSTFRASSALPPISSMTFGTELDRGWIRRPLPAAAITPMRGRAHEDGSIRSRVRACNSCRGVRLC